MNAKRAATPKRRVDVDVDVDAPLGDEEFERGRTAVLARAARNATGLSQTEFAERYGVPVASLRDWEQGRRTPDAATVNYLRVIAKIPDAVAKALGDAARNSRK